jgi:predicted amino acid racemase
MIRISNLKKIKALDPTIQTVYIKPPAKRSIEKIVHYADVSFNTEIDTIKCSQQKPKINP